MSSRVIVRLATVMLAGVLTVASSVSALPSFEAGLHFNAGFPQGDFKDQVDKNAFGIGGQAFLAPGGSPFAIGIELGFMNYGNEKRKEPFSTTIPDVTVDVTTSNNIVQGFLVFRGHLPQGPIRPYADALVGFNYLFTETKISNSSNNEEVASSNNFDDGVFAYGFGGGFMVPVYKSQADKAKPIVVSLDAGLRYILGGEAEYLKKGSIVREGGKASFDTIKSKTDMLRLHVGVMVRF